jgi:hypothetical protein
MSPVAPGGVDAQLFSIGYLPSPEIWAAAFFQWGQGLGCPRAAFAPPASFRSSRHTGLVDNLLIDRVMRTN